MFAGPARLGLWFALTLALPAAFAGAWLWLEPGGVVARARAAERHAAEQALLDAEQALLARLHAAATQSSIVLRLDPQRHVVAPFAAAEPPAQPPAEPAPAVPVAIAERAAIARLDAADPVAALPFFSHAVAEGSLSPVGWLRYAAALGEREPEAARELLQRARERFVGTRVGPLPFALLASLAELRIGGRPGLADGLVQALQEVPAASVSVALDEVVAIAPDLLGERGEVLRAAAAAAMAFAGTPVPAAPAPGPAGAVLLPLDPGRCAVLTAAQVAAARALTFAEAARREPSVALAIGAQDGAPTSRVAALGETWCALPVHSAPPSVLLARLARLGLVLAGATLVLGNLLLWRLTRRESQLVRMRSDFVDVVSHELRTPLTALSLKSEMLAAGDVPAERRDHYLAALHQDVLRLGDQVERILDFGRLQRGAALRRELVPARTLLARGVRQGRPALRLVAQQLSLAAPRVLPSIVGDVEVLGRALRNLLENAAKYAPPGSTVAVRAFARGDELVVEVADTGPGVPATERSGIFQPFVRGSRAPTGTPGSGLGLALVEAAAASHGGRVTVADRPGGGAVFSIHLPVRRTEVS